MSFRADDVMRALDGCYDAVAEPDLWPRALQALAESIGASAAMFYPKDINQDAAQMPASPEYVEFLEHYVRNGWYKDHYRAERGWPLLERAPMTVVLEHDLASDDERRHLRHYNDLYLRWGYQGFAAFGFRVDGQSWCVPFLRSVRQGFFDRSEAEALSFLPHHFARMARLTKRFSRLGGASGLAALDRFDRAAVLLGWDGAVAELNGKAETLLKRNGCPLQLRSGRLCAVHPEADRRLQALVAASLRPAVGPTWQRQTDPVTIPRLLGRPLLVEAIALPQLVEPFSGRAGSLLTISDLDEPVRAPAARMAEIFALTPAETRLCEALMSGLPLKEAAERLRITESTARQRLKVIFHKTETSRQSELILLMSKF